MRKRKVSSSCYEHIINIGIPIHIAFNPEDGLYYGIGYNAKLLTKHERRLMNNVRDELRYEHGCADMVRYLEECHPEEWMNLMSKVSKEWNEHNPMPERNIENKVPKEFLDAFKEENEE